MKKTVAAMLICGTLAACAEPVAITRDPVDASVLASVPSARLTKGTTRMMIRAYKSENGKISVASEIGGAKCTLVSDELRATLIAPQEVILPQFKQRKEFPNRGVPGALLITCEAGKLSGKKLVTVNEKAIGTTTGAGAGGALVTILATTALATSTPWAYPFGVNVVMDE